MITISWFLKKGLKTPSCVQNHFQIDKNSCLPIAVVAAAVVVVADVGTTCEKGQKAGKGPWQGPYRPIWPSFPWVVGTLRGWDNCWNFAFCVGPMQQSRFQTGVICLHPEGLPARVAFWCRVHGPSCLAWSRAWVCTDIQTLTLVKVLRQPRQKPTYEKVLQYMG